MRGGPSLTLSRHLPHVPSFSAMRSFQGSSRKLLLTYLVTSKPPPRKPRPLPLLCAPPPRRCDPRRWWCWWWCWCCARGREPGRARAAEPPAVASAGLPPSPPPLLPAPCARFKKSPRRASALGKARAAESPAPAPEAVGFAHTAVAGRDGVGKLSSPTRPLSVPGAGLLFVAPAPPRSPTSSASSSRGLLAIASPERQGVCHQGPGHEEHFASGSDGKVELNISLI